MLTAKNFRLDWHNEFKKLAPYLAGRCGVIRLEYKSEDAAPGIFNYHLKEMFSRNGNQMWLSLRIDQEWYTTHRARGILDEMDRLLTKVGFPAEKPRHGLALTGLANGNDVGGDLTVAFENSTLNLGGLPKESLHERAEAVCAAMSRYIAAGGHFMIVLNDAPLRDQAVFWRDVWESGLSAMSGHLLLVIHAGPGAGGKVHPDCPGASETLFLPDSVQSDETRLEQIYDDLIGIFRAEGIADAEARAQTHLAGNADSMSRLHATLSTVIMKAKQRLGSTC